MKYLVGLDAGSYTFNFSEKKILISGFPALALERILLVTNVTTNQIIYQFNSEDKGGTIAFAAGINTLTLKVAVAGTANDNRLQIFIEHENILAKDGTDGAAPPSIPGTGIRGWLRSIYDKLVNIFTAIEVVGFVSGGNSTSTILGINEIFTGEWEDVLKFTNISITITSDVASITDGLKVEYSTNGVDVDADDVFTFIAGTKKQYSFGITAKYVRVRYFNGPVAQTFFRLQTIYHRGSPKASSHRISDMISNEDDAELFKGILFGKNVNNAYLNIKSSLNGSMIIADNSIERLEAGFSFVSVIQRNSIAAPENIFLFRNLGSKTVRFDDIELYFNTASSVTWEVYRNPTITANGTAVAAINANSGSSNVATATLFDAPTIAGLGTQIRSFLTDPNNRNNKQSYSLILAPGHSILLRRLNVGLGNELGLTFQWTEDV